MLKILKSTRRSKASAGDVEVFQGRCGEQNLLTSLLLALDIADVVRIDENKLTG
jgi:hypothetical protein